MPYSMSDELDAADQGAIVDSKRLSHVLQISQEVQSKRDSRSVSGHSTAHRQTPLSLWPPGEAPLILNDL